MKNTMEKKRSLKTVKPSIAINFCDDFNTGDDTYICIESILDLTNKERKRVLDKLLAILPEHKMDISYGFNLDSSTILTIKNTKTREWKRVVETVRDQHIKDRVYDIDIIAES